MSRSLNHLLLGLVLTAILSLAASAQTTERLCSMRMSEAESAAAASKKHKKNRKAAAESFALCNGGVVDSYALSKPDPVYPERAKAAGITGTVALRVCIDEEGKVYALAVCSGHPLLNAAAVRAAYQARFKPVLRSGKPTKFNGILTYKFARK